MKRKVLLFLTAFSVVTLMIYAVYPPLGKWMEMTRGIQAIRGAGVDKPVTRNEVYQVHNLDGFTSEDLADYYEDAAQALADLSPEAVSYRWSDNVLFYSRVSTLLRFPGGGYIEVIASHNNDNDAVSICFSDQPFTDKGRTEMVRINSHVVPASLFRPDRAR